MKSPVLITAALGGLGSNFALACAERGDDLILIDYHQQPGQFPAYLTETFGISARYIHCDLSSSSARKQLLTQLKKEKLTIKGLINVVGRETEGPFLSQNREALLSMIDLNIKAMVDLSLGVLNLRDPRQRFELINVASLAGYFPMPNKAVYSSSKQFMINFSLALREEIKSFGSVLVLCPAGLPTTAESMKKIFLQGFWGKLTAQDTEKVVRKSLKKVRQNRSIYIPGTANQLLVWLAHFLPKTLLVRYLSRRWQKSQKGLDFWRMNQDQR